MDSISIITNSGPESQNSAQTAEDGFSVIFSRDREEAVAKRIVEKGENAKGNVGSQKGKWVRYSFCCALLILLAIALILMAFWHSKQQEEIDAHQNEVEFLEMNLGWKKFELENQEMKLRQENLKEMERFEMIGLQKQMLELTRDQNASMAQRLQNTVKKRPGPRIFEGGFIEENWDEMMSPKRGKLFGHFKREMMNEAIGICTSALENATEQFYSVHWKFVDFIRQYYFLNFRLRQAGFHSGEVEYMAGAYEQMKNNASSRVEQLKGNLTEKQRKIGEIEGKIREFEGNIISLNGTFHKMETELEGMSSGIEEKDKQIGKKEELVGKARIERDEGEKATNSSIIAELREQLGQREIQLNQLEKLTNEQGDEAKKTMEAHAESTDQAHDLHIATKENTIKELQGKIDTLNAQIDEKQKTLDAKWVEIHRLERCRYYWWC